MSRYVVISERIRYALSVLASLHGSYASIWMWCAHSHRALIAPKLQKIGSISRLAPAATKTHLIRTPCAFGLVSPWRSADTLSRSSSNTGFYGGWHQVLLHCRYNWQCHEVAWLLISKKYNSVNCPSSKPLESQKDQVSYDAQRLRFNEASSSKCWICREAWRLPGSNLTCPCKKSTKKNL